MNRKEWCTAATQLGRTSLLGVTIVFGLQGLASAGHRASAGDVAVTIVAAAAFHVTVYLWNDVVDLPIDRTVARRAKSPLVRGTISLGQAKAIVAVGAAAAIGVSATQGPAAVAVMAAAIALIGAYDVWGKRAAFPPLTDAVQGLGWAALAWFGALAGGGGTRATLWLGAYLTISIVLINGVHGSIRDLANDARHSARTTALLLGAHVEPSGHHVLPRGLWVYALTLHVATVSLIVLGLVDVGTATSSRVGAAVLAGAGCLVLLVLALARADSGDRAWPVSFAYLVVMMLAPTLLVLEHVRGPLLWAIAVIFVAPWLASQWLRSTLRQLPPVRRQAST